MSDKELFLGYIKAYNGKDVTGMLRFFAEDCVLGYRCSSSRAEKSSISAITVE